MRYILNLMISIILILAGLIGTYINISKIGEIRDLERDPIKYDRIYVKVTSNDFQAKIIFSLVTAVLGLMLLNQELNRQEVLRLHKSPKSESGDKTTS